jgi:2-polyprenyl-6-methoxyphenol hydroxylase-like FAD-dependent oxidoreductase
MTPARGIGANTALRDSALLGRNLVAAHRGEMSLQQAIHDYEVEMIKYGFAAVLRSRQGITFARMGRI